MDNRVSLAGVGQVSGDSWVNPTVRTDPRQGELQSHCR